MLNLSLSRPVVSPLVLAFVRSCVPGSFAGFYQEIGSFFIAVGKK
jgi:hypothetical protein